MTLWAHIATVERGAQRTSSSCSCSDAQGTAKSVVGATRTTFILSSFRFLEPFIASCSALTSGQIELAASANRRAANRSSNSTLIGPPTMLAATLRTNRQVEVCANDNTWLPAAANTPQLGVCQVQRPPRSRQVALRAAAQEAH